MLYCWIVKWLNCWMTMIVDKKEYLTLNKIVAYKNSFLLSNEVWDMVGRWDDFAKRTIGSQFVRAADSVSANIAEGFGRYGKKDKVYFYRIARASVYESLDWLEKSKRRHILSGEDYEKLFTQLKKLPRDINILIKYTNEHLNS